MRIINMVAFVAVALACSSLVAPALAEEFTVGSYNTESGDADPATVSARIQQLRCDLYGFSEVNDTSWADQFRDAAAVGMGGGARFSRWYGTTGGKDLLVLVWNREKFDLMETPKELKNIQHGNYRAPLYGHFKHKTSGVEFLFMVNHLARGKSAIRHRQAQDLNDWARTQTLPIIAVGDYNFDWEVDGGDQFHDDGYDNMVFGGTWRWVRPQALVRSQISGDYDSVLDFCFVAGPARTWTSSSQIIQVAGDEPDDSKKSDHRPLVTTITLPSGPDDAAGSFGATPAPAPADEPTPAPTAAAAPQATLESLLRRLQALETEVGDLRRLAEGLRR